MSSKSWGNDKVSFPLINKTEVEVTWILWGSIEGLPQTLTLAIPVAVLIHNLFSSTELTAHLLWIHCVLFRLKVQGFLEPKGMSVNLHPILQSLRIVRPGSDYFISVILKYM